MNTNLYGAPFAGFTTSLFPLTGPGHRDLTTEEVADLATLFPNTIYFQVEE